LNILFPNPAAKPNYMLSHTESASPREVDVEIQQIQKAWYLKQSLSLSEHSSWNYLSLLESQSVSVRNEPTDLSSHSIA
jgi:hypothetical protein